ncbi:unnamed protein product [Lathyrus sativus]|nr:unnamed protein product [Lathyrus sativus]
MKKEVKLHAIHNQKRKATQGQRDIAHQCPLSIRSSTSAFLRDKNGYILAVEGTRQNDPVTSGEGVFSNLLIREAAHTRG